MSDLFWLEDAQMVRVEPSFPKSHGEPRVYDRRVVSEIIFIICNGLRWREAPAAHCPQEAGQNRWSNRGTFARKMAGLAAQYGEQKPMMIDSTYLKIYRPATSWGVRKEVRTSDWPDQGRHENQAPLDL